MRAQIIFKDGMVEQFDGLANIRIHPDKVELATLYGESYGYWSPKDVKSISYVDLWGDVKTTTFE